LVRPDGDPEPQSAPARILVVEDEPLIRFAIAEVLRDLGAAVVEAATGDEAWDYLKTGTVDLVFTDHRMPGKMSGAQLAAAIRESYPSIEVMIASGYFDASERPAPVLKKPYPMHETAAQLIDLALGKRRGRGA
jgi:CheY-like chemotaxis protein